MKTNILKFTAILLILAGFFSACENKEPESKISGLNFTPCKQTQQTKAKSNAPSDGVSVVFANNGVHITYNHFEVTCDFSTVDVTYTFVNGFLNITQQGSPNRADCVCYSDVSYTINGISQSDVNVIFINGEQVYCHNDTTPNDIVFPVDIDFVVIVQWSMGHGYFQKQFSVITTETDWEDLKTQLISSYPPVTNKFTETDIDFLLYQVIFVIDYIKGNGGWSIDVTDVTEYTDKIVVTVSNLFTGSASSVITQPFQIVKIPVSEKPIIFNDLTLNP